jgi:hypothetical protein
MPFEKSLLFKIEHGPLDDLNATYEGAVFAYIAKNKNLSCKQIRFKFVIQPVKLRTTTVLHHKTGPGVLRMIISGGMSPLSLADWEERIRGPVSLR